VLKGVGSKVLADRRGAYYAGNLRALHDMMGDNQRLRFRQWCVRIAIRRAQSILPHFENKYPQPHLREVAAAIEAWCEHPSPRLRDEVRNAIAQEGRQNVPTFLEDPLTARVDSARMAVLFTANAVFEDALFFDYITTVFKLASRVPGSPKHRIDESLKRAMVRAAYTILQQG